MALERSKHHAEVPVGSPSNRIQALADGIFAVAMTILVLELHVPDLGQTASDAHLRSALQDLLPKGLSFASGFLILGDFVDWTSFSISLYPAHEPGHPRSPLRARA